MLKQAVSRRRLLLGGSLRSTQWNLPILEPLSPDAQALAGFKELDMPLFESLYNFASWLVHNKSNAEDLVQETYLRALRGFASFHPGANFRTGVFRMLRNTFLSSRSTLGQRMTVEIDWEDDTVLPATSATPESTLIERFHEDAVRNAIEKLPIIFREVLLLCDVEDASYREISEILSLPIGTVMSRVARARKALCESLLSVPQAPRSHYWSHEAALPGRATGPTQNARN